MAIRVFHADGDNWAEERYRAYEPKMYQPPESMVAPHSRKQQQADAAPVEEEFFDDSDIDKDIELLKAKDKDLKKRNLRN